MQGRRCQWFLTAQAALALRGAWETFTRDEIAISVELGDVAVVRVVGVEPCLCFGIRGEVAAVLRISRIPRYRRLRRGACVGASVDDGGDAGVGDSVDVNDHFRCCQRVETDVTVVVGFDNQPVRRHCGDCPVVVEVGFADIAAAVFRDSIVAPVGGHEPGAGDTVHRQIPEHSLTANRLRHIHPQHPTRSH